MAVLTNKSDACAALIQALGIKQKNLIAFALAFRVGKLPVLTVEYHADEVDVSAAELSTLHEEYVWVNRRDMGLVGNGGDE